VTDLAEPAPKTAAEAELRRRAKFFSIIVLGAFALILASVITSLDIGSLSQNFSFGLLVQRLVPELPALFYVLAALSAQRILDRVSEGQFFTAVNIKALADMGGAMLWGAGWSVFLLLAINDWTRGVYDYRVDFRPEPLVIGAIGLSLLVLGRLLLRARQLEAEMEAIV
jgi:hypothetical protein